VIEKNIVLAEGVKMRIEGGGGGGELRIMNNTFGSEGGKSRDGNS
jgi:hypothetical protein